MKIRKAREDDFGEYSKLKNCKSVLLKVNKRNVNAIRLYNRFGFEITNYIMRKKLK